MQVKSLSHLTKYLLPHVCGCFFLSSIKLRFGECMTNSCSVSDSPTLAVDLCFDSTFTSWLLLWLMLDLSSPVSLGGEQCFGMFVLLYLSMIDWTVLHEMSNAWKVVSIQIPALHFPITSSLNCLLCSLPFMMLFIHQFSLWSIWRKSLYTQLSYGNSSSCASCSG